MKQYVFQPSRGTKCGFVRVQKYVSMNDDISNMWTTYRLDTQTAWSYNKGYTPAQLTHERDVSYEYGVSDDMRTVGEMYQQYSSGSLLAPVFKYEGSPTPSLVNVYEFVMMEV